MEMKNNFGFDLGIHETAQAARCRFFLIIKVGDCAVVHRRPDRRSHPILSPHSRVGKADLAPYRIGPLGYAHGANQICNRVGRSRVKTCMLRGELRQG